MKITLDHVVNISDNVKTFWFKTPKEVDYLAGQYIELLIPHDNPDDRGVKRWFTLSSSPTEFPLISVTTKFADIPSTYKKAMLNLSPGSQLDIVEPMGDFVLPKDKQLPLVYVAGGIGITPVRSMIKFLIDSDEKRKVQIIYAARQEKDLVFKDLFDEYPLILTPVLSAPSQGWNGQKGQLSVERIISLTNSDYIDGLIYISGPEPMVESLVKDLEGKVEKNKLVTDYFPGYISV